MVVFLTSLLTLLLALTGCGRPAGGEETAVSEARRAVRVARVESQTLADELAVSGLLVARDEATVGAELAGNRVAQVRVDRGDLVRKGQVLVVLDATLIEAQLGQLDARVAEAKAAVADAEARSRRADALERAGATSSADRETLGFGLESARAALQASTAQQAELRTRLERLTIRAPASGRVIERNVWTGEIAGGGTPMLRIAVDDEIELDAEVPEHELSRLRVGGAARVVLPSGETVPGEIRRIDPDVDPAEKLGRARIALPQHPGLRSGGFARALIAHDERSSPMAPEAALRFSTDGESVLTVDAEGKVKSVRVKTGARSGGRVELLEGPAAGERVIVGGAAFVLEGDAVEAIETATNEAPSDGAAAEDAASR